MALPDTGYISAQWQLASFAWPLLMITIDPVVSITQRQDHLQQFPFSCPLICSKVALRHHLHASGQNLLIGEAPPHIHLSGFTATLLLGVFNYNIHKKYLI